MSQLASRRATTLLLLAAAAVAQITPGHLIVVRAGDGLLALSNSARSMFLDEYDHTTPAQATPLQSLLLPITIAGLASQGYAPSRGMQLTIGS